MDSKAVANVIARWEVKAWDFDLAWAAVCSNNCYCSAYVMPTFLTPNKSLSKSHVFSKPFH
jgi:hypothetical protein